jgi:hypothetical protein
MGIHAREARILMAWSAAGGASVRESKGGSVGRREKRVGYGGERRGEVVAGSKRRRLRQGRGPAMK